MYQNRSNFPGELSLSSATTHTSLFPGGTNIIRTEQIFQEKEIPQEQIKFPGAAFSIFFVRTDRIFQETKNSYFEKIASLDAFVAWENGARVFISKEKFCFFFCMLQYLLYFSPLFINKKNTDHKNKEERQNNLRNSYKKNNLNRYIVYID